MKEYNSTLKQHLVFFRSQLANVTSKSTREISALKRNVEWFKNNRTKGTKQDFVNYVKRSANAVLLGQYKEGLLHNGGLASDIVRSYAVQRANRMLVHQIVKHLKKINNG